MNMYMQDKIGCVEGSVISLGLFGFMDNGELLDNAIFVWFCFPLFMLGDSEPLQSAPEGCRSEFCISISQYSLSLSFQTAGGQHVTALDLSACSASVVLLLWGFLKVLHIDPSPW